MKLHEINPFVRYARREEKGFLPQQLLACDHRLFYLREGRIRLQVNGQVYSPEQGSLIYWRAGSPYLVTECENAQLIGCNFDFTQKHRQLSAPITPVACDVFSGVLEKAEFTDCKGFQNVMILEKAYSLGDRLEQLVEEYEKRELYYAQICSAILKEILVTAVRLSETGHTGKSAQLAQEVLRYIRTHYREEITNGSIAAQFGYHPNYLNSLILQHTGTSMHRYLLNYRMNRAVELLQNTTLSITAVAEAVGLPDMQHFSKCFKKIVGYPPSYYKKAVGRVHTQ